MWEKIKRWLGLAPEPVPEKVTKVPTAPAGGLPTEAPEPPPRPHYDEALPLPEQYEEEDDGSGETLQELYDMEEPDWSELDPLGKEEDDEGLPPVHITERESEYREEHPLPDSDVDESFWDLAPSEEATPYREITGEIPYTQHEVYSRGDEPPPPPPSRDFLDDYEREAAEEKVESVFGASDLSESGFTIPLEDEELPPDLYAGDYFDAQGRRNLKQDPSTAEN